jgi:hypothetical protein
LPEVFFFCYGKKNALSGLQTLFERMTKVISQGDSVKALSIVDGKVVRDEIQ